MARIQSFPLPDVGEGLTEAEILTWHVAAGDTVTVNQIIVEIETAKAAVELPSPYAGVVTELFAEPGATVAVGSPLIAIDVDPGEVAASGTSGEQAAGERISTLVGYGPRTGAVSRRRRKTTRAPAGPPASGVAGAAAGGTVPLAKPPVRRLARELGIDLRVVLGTGAGGVITREDVQHAAGLAGNGAGSTAASGAGSPAAASGAGPSAAASGAGSPAAASGAGPSAAASGAGSPAAASGAGPSAAASGAGAAAGRQRREPVRGVRKATAAAVVSSAFTAPHVTVFLTVDVTPMMELRARLREQPWFRDVKLTPLVFAARALCLAARRTPEVNASWDEAAGEIVYFDYVHLGIATATPRGLVVPKVRDADRIPLRELAVALDELATSAREGRTPPADMLGGTISITNVGVFGVDTGTPILNPGESAILALGAIRDMPWVVDGAVVVRKVCQLALSVDHRIVDGQQAAQFLTDIGALLTDPALAITY